MESTPIVRIVHGLDGRKGGIADRYRDSWRRARLSGTGWSIRKSMSRTAEGIWTDENRAEISRVPTIVLRRPDIFEQECGIGQPAAFVRRETFAAGGRINAKRNFCLDSDL